MRFNCCLYGLNGACGLGAAYGLDSACGLDDSKGVLVLE